MRTVPSAIWPSGAAGAASVAGWALGALWPAPACAGFSVCAAAVNWNAEPVATAPTRAPTRTNRFIPASRFIRGLSMITGSIIQGCARWRGTGRMDEFAPAVGQVGQSSLRDDNIAAECPDAQRRAAVAESRAD